MEGEGSGASEDLPRSCADASAEGPPKDKARGLRSPTLSGKMVEVTFQKSMQFGSYYCSHLWKIQSATE